MAMKRLLYNVLVRGKPQNLVGEPWLFGSQLDALMISNSHDFMQKIAIDTLLEAFFVL